MQSIPELLSSSFRTPSGGVRETVLTLLLLVGASAVSAAQNVVLVVVDGARYSETFGAGRTCIPRIWQNLRPAGTVWTNFRNDSLTLTGPGHAAILSGVWPNIPNVGTVRGTAPTVFEYFRKQTAAPESAVYVIAGKEKLGTLTYSTHRDYGPAYGARPVLAGDDPAVAAAADSILFRIHPRLIVVHFPDVDLRGHDGDWAGYLRAISRVDSLIGRIWDNIQVDPFYRGKTTLFVTNDHGRHLSDFAGHGDGCEGCRHIMLVAVGRNIPRGRVVDRIRQQTDLAPTIGDLLGFTTPLATGSTLLADTIAMNPDTSDIPGNVRLMQDMPNPFDSAATVSYEVRRKTHVRLEVSDLLGRHVASLVDTVQLPGTYSLVFSAAGIPSGAYFLNLCADARLETRRLILVP